jgi:hypothetical protein
VTYSLIRSRSLSLRFSTIFLRPAPRSWKFIYDLPGVTFTNLKGEELWASEGPAIDLPITALLIAVDSNNLPLARVLLYKGAEVNSGRTPLSMFEQNSRRTVDRKDEQRQPLKNCIFLYIFPYLLHLLYLLFSFGGVWHL